jgi:hypothetical protein
MATSVQVQCINKIPRNDIHNSIRNIGGIRSDGVRWTRPQKQAIEDIEAGTYSYWVRVNEVSVWVIVATHNGHKYLKTQNDREHENNLLSLPECP